MIKARIPARNPNANLNSYDDFYSKFKWEDIEKEFSWYGSDKMNIIAESIDRWAKDPQKCDHPALIFQKLNNTQSYTYKELHIKSCQWANLLAKFGFSTGDRLMILLPPCPEIFFVDFGLSLSH